jgi:hypothetical protein
MEFIWVSRHLPTGVMEGLGHKALRIKQATRETAQQERRYHRGVWMSGMGGRYLGPEIRMVSYSPT